MQRTAKLFKNGRSQAVRLPSDFRFEGDEVRIRKNPETGEVILSPQEKSFENFFRLRDQLTQEERDQFIVPPRDRTPMKPPNLF